MFSALALILSASVLYFVLRYRVHIHVEYTPKAGTRRNVAGTSASKARVRASGEVPPRVNLQEAELISALVNLGTSKPRAKEAAGRALFHQDLEFETALRRAIDYARMAA